MVTFPEALVTITSGNTFPITFTIESVGTRDIETWYVSFNVDFTSGEGRLYRDWEAEIPLGSTLYRSIPAAHGDEAKQIESVTVHEVRLYHL